MGRAREAHAAAELLEIQVERAALLVKLDIRRRRFHAGHAAHSGHHVADVLGVHEELEELRRGGGLLRAGGDTPAPAAVARHVLSAPVRHGEEKKVITQRLGMGGPHPVADEGDGGDFLAIERVIAFGGRGHVARLHPALEMRHRLHGGFAVQRAGGGPGRAVDEVAAEGLHDGREAIGIPFALAIVELDVERIFDAFDLGELGQRVFELRHGPGIGHARWNAHAGLGEQRLRSPERQARIAHAEGIELAVRRVGALGDQRRDHVVNGRLGDEIIERGEIAGPHIVRIVRAVEIEEVGKAAGQGRRLHLLVIGAFGLDLENRLHVRVRLVPVGNQSLHAAALAIAASAMVPHLDRVGGQRRCTGNGNRRRRNTAGENRAAGGFQSCQSVHCDVLPDALLKSLALGRVTRRAGKTPVPPAGSARDQARAPHRRFSARPSAGPWPAARSRNRGAPPWLAAVAPFPRRV